MNTTDVATLIGYYLGAFGVGMVAALLISVFIKSSNRISY